MKFTLQKIERIAKRKRNLLRRLIYSFRTCRAGSATPLTCPRVCSAQPPLWLLQVHEQKPTFPTGSNPAPSTSRLLPLPQRQLSRSGSLSPYINSPTSPCTEDLISPGHPETPLIYSTAKPCRTRHDEEDGATSQQETGVTEAVEPQHDTAFATQSRARSSGSVRVPTNSPRTSHRLRDSTLHGVDLIGDGSFESWRGSMVWKRKS